MGDILDNNKNILLLCDKTIFNNPKYCDGNVKKMQEQGFWY